MRKRAEVARLIERQLHHTHRCSREKGEQIHYGWQELRELMDFIYDGTPAADEELHELPSWQS